MNCPNCGQGLRSISYEGIEIETCDGCGGEWLDAPELGIITKLREQCFSPEERRAIAVATPSREVHLGDADRDLPCPKCGATTDAINYGGTSGIILDRCTGCGGFWLDATELEKVQMLIEGWDDLLPDDLAQHGKTLRDIESAWDEADNVKLSRFKLVNLCLNGILDLLD